MNNLSVLYISIIIVSLIGLISSIISSYYSNKLSKIKAREKRAFTRAKQFIIGHSERLGRNLKKGR